jgi:ribosomal protein L18
MPLHRQCNVLRSRRKRPSGSVLSWYAALPRLVVRRCLANIGAQCQRSSADGEATMLPRFGVTAEGTDAASRVLLDSEL